jgi:uncharacterized RDD family membrane protein YckC
LTVVSTTEWRTMERAGCAPAGILRRGCAFLADLFLLVGALFTALGAVSFVSPLDSPIGSGVLMVLGFGGLALFFASPAVGISPGRALMGIRVVDRVSGERPSLAQAGTRSLTLGLWPIEIVVASASRDGRRLGDRLARTIAIRDGSRPVRLGAAAAACIGVMVLGIGSFYVAMSNLASLDAARGFWEVEGDGASLGWSARCFSSSSGSAVLVVPLSRAGGDGVRFEARRRDGAWLVEHATRYPAGSSDLDC